VATVSSSSHLAAAMRCTDNTIAIGSSAARRRLAAFNQENRRYSSASITRFSPSMDRGYLNVAPNAQSGCSISSFLVCIERVAMVKQTQFHSTSSMSVFALSNSFKLAS